MALMAHGTSTSYGKEAIARYNERSAHPLFDPAQVIPHIDAAHEKAILDAQAGLITAVSTILDSGAQQSALNIAHRGQFTILAEGVVDLSHAYQAAFMENGRSPQEAAAEGARYATNDFSQMERNVVARQHALHTAAEAGRVASASAVEKAGVTQREGGWAQGKTGG